MTAFAGLDAYYGSVGMITDPGELRLLLEDLPRGIDELCRVLQGLMLHAPWAERCGVNLSEAHREELNLRFVSRQLACIQAMNHAPLAKERPLEQRLVGTCRDYSALLCAILQHQGVPARARCGFGRYGRKR